MTAKAKTVEKNASARSVGPLEDIRQAVADSDQAPHGLSEARVGLMEVAKSADDAFLPDVARCARLIADLLEISECVPTAPDAEEESAEQLKQLTLSGIEALGNRLDEQPEALQQIAQFEQTARNAWGEYLALSINHSASDRSDADASFSEPVETGDESDGASSQDVPVVDMKKVLAALGSLPSSADSQDENGEKDPSADDLFQEENDSGSAVPEPPEKPEQSEIDPALLEAFLEDACQGLGAMEQAVLGFEAEPTSHEPLVQVCRELHTLKGAASSVGLRELASYLHHVEDFTGACRSMSPTSVNVEPMFQAVDAVRAQIEALGGKTDAGFAPHQAETSAPKRFGTVPVTAAKSQRVPTEHVATTLPPQAGGSLRVESERLDRLMDLLAELVTLRNSRDNRLHQLKEVAAELSRCAGRIRATGDTRLLLGLNPRLENGESHGAAEWRPDISAQGALGAEPGSSLFTEVASDVSELARSLRELEEPLSEDNRVVSRLIGQFRHELIDLRRVPATGLFRRLERPARDAARSEGKQVKLIFVGEDARIDRSLQEGAYEPLLHIVRNAVSHGIETPAERQSAGKPAVGTVTLEARSSPSLLVIEVRDDGRGMDFKTLEERGRERGLLPQAGPVPKEELLRLIFHPGFSTRTTVSEVSGRGVGMDVVARAIERMGGHVAVDSVSGQGTTLRLSIPLRAAIEHAMLVRVAGQIFALPLHHVDAASEGELSTHPNPTETSGEPGNRKVRMGDLLGLPHPRSSGEEGCVILSHGEIGRSDHRDLSEDKVATGAVRHLQRFPLVVDSIIGPEEVVVRSLPPMLRSSKLFSGVTLSGAGEIVLLFNVQHLIALRQAFVERGEQSPGSEKPDRGGTSRLRVLVVDDSLSARRGMAQILERWGIRVDGGADGMEALDLLRQNTYDLILTDLEMPKLGGLELLAETKRRHSWRNIPVVVVSGRGDRATRNRAEELGADGFLLKPVSQEVFSRTLAELNLLKLSEAPQLHGSEA